MEILNMEVTTCNGKPEVTFDLKRNRGDTLCVTVVGDGVWIDGLAYEGDTYVVVPMEALRRAFAAMELAREWGDHPQLTYGHRSGRFGVRSVYGPPPRFAHAGYELVDVATGAVLSAHRTVLEAFEAAAKEGV